MNGAPPNEKERLRVWARARRRELPPTPCLLEHLRFWLRERGARRVLAYRAFGGEPSLDALAGEFELFTTRANWRPAPHLTLHPWNSATERGKLGMLEPPEGTPQIAQEQVEVVLVPGLAYDERGVRLGYGGGFYDRLLPTLSALRVGVIQAGLVVAELPCEPHDARVAFLATEAGVRGVRPEVRAEE